MKYFLGIDNGTSGTIALLDEDGDAIFFIETPAKIEQSYTKTKQNISRVDTVRLREILTSYSKEPITAIIERPLVNPKMFKTTMSAMRALEATLCLLEELQFPHLYVDSKQWQKEMLPSGTKGSPELKKASLDIATRLFPKYRELIKKHKDGDALLIAEWARTHNM